MLRYRDFFAFYLFSFLFLALLPILSLLFNNGSMDFSAAAAAASESIGVEWTSNILNVVRLSIEEPVLLLTLLGSLAPALAAITVLIYLRSRSLWSSFRSRFKLYNNCSSVEAATIYLAIFALLIPCLFLVYEFRIALGLDYARGTAIDPYLIIAVLTIAFLDQGALLEEVGWRGFVGPELQKFMSNPLYAAVLVGICWGLWHIPRDITTGVIGRLGAFNYLALFLPSFLLGTISVSIIACYFMNRLGGSIVAAIIIHGITNDSIGISGGASIVDALTPIHQITKNLPFALVATGIVYFSGIKLGKPNHDN